MLQTTVILSVLLLASYLAYSRMYRWMKDREAGLEALSPSIQIPVQKSRKVIRNSLRVTTLLTRLKIKDP